MCIAPGQAAFVQLAGYPDTVVELLEKGSFSAATCSSGGWACLTQGSAGVLS